MVNSSVILSGDRWSIGRRQFGSPRDEIVATDHAEVRLALAEATAAARSGAWVVGYVSYQSAPGFDRRLSVRTGPMAVPLVWFGVFDDGEPLDDLSSEPPPTLGDWRASMDRSDHGRRVAAIREAIAAGDTYQVNLTFPVTASVSGSPLSLLGALSRAQPRSYGALIDLGDRQVISVSPEMFFRRTGSRVVTRPMKGTGQRGRWVDEDLRLMNELVSSQKERAGNVMIVDMIRNDLGKLAVPGSIRTPELYVPEQHPTVWQLTSSVEAEVAAGVELVDLFTALFPSGSVTGAPKESTMSIIAATETAPRGIYCGAIGYIAPGADDAEFSVAIRSGVVVEGRFTYHVGGGITFDSVADDEYDECLWKALVLAEDRPVPDLIETMRFVPGIGIPLVSRHMDRLARSAVYWGIEFDAASVDEALSSIVSGSESRVRLLLTSGGRTQLSIDPMPVWDEPVSLEVSGIRVDPSDRYRYHKVADRSRYPQSDDQTEMLLVNLGGEVVETNRSNLMARIDGQWFTPPIESGCLPGVGRAVALGEDGVLERRLTMEDVTGAGELAVTNALRGWRKAVLVR